MFNNRHWVFGQQDSAPAHRAKSTQDWLAAREIEIRHEDSSSPGLRPLDYKIWQHLEEKACSKPHPNLESLKTSLIKAAADIDMDLVSAAIDDWPRRLKACIQNHGGERPVHRMEPLQVDVVYFYPKENAQTHNTVKYEAVNEENPTTTIVRRGQPFNGVVRFTREYDESIDMVQLIFTIGDKLSMDTQGSVFLSRDAVTDNHRWSAKLIDAQADTLSFEVRFQMLHIIRDYCKCRCTRATRHNHEKLEAATKVTEARDSHLWPVVDTCRQWLHYGKGERANTNSIVFEL
ncbi:hypothetical protein evm_010992 [Chilo suppressalis]|nr:hypothetical protein evm_010992 [Chilo suppressalis]